MHVTVHITYCVFLHYLVEIILSVIYNFNYLKQHFLRISQVYLQDAIFLLTL